MVDGHLLYKHFYMCLKNTSIKKKKIHQDSKVTEFSCASKRKMYFYNHQSIYMFEKYQSLCESGMWFMEPRDQAWCSWIL